MNRDQLDEFFAKADDVLNDWQGSADSMNTSPPPQQFLDFLDSVEAPGFQHRQLLERVYQSDPGHEQYWEWRRTMLATVMAMPIVPSRSLFIGSIG